MDEKTRVLHIIEILKKAYPPTCSLIAEKPYELLFATRLSAQCTDARVNLVTKELFSKYKTLESIAECDLSDLEKIIKPCGLFHTKARDIKNAANMLIEVYHSKVPDTIEELTRLPGVGRKTANLIVGDIYGKPAIVADTHCIRISNRLGLCNTKDPYKVELALKKIIPPEEQSDFCHRLVHYGRDVCTARSPKCGACVLSKYCPSSSQQADND